MIPAGVQMVNQYTPTGVSTEKGPTGKAAGICGQHRSLIILARVHVPITVAKIYNPEHVYKVNVFIALLQG